MFFQLEGQDLAGENVTAEDIKEKLPAAEFGKIAEMSKDKHLYQHLINSLFPTIFGKSLLGCGRQLLSCDLHHSGSDEVKRGVLLMLFGGVPKVTVEGTRLRGDINTCIVGDPSCAKSQFLK